MKRLFVSLLIFLVICSAISLDLSKANPYGPPNVNFIYIKADGSIEPANAPISRIGSNEYHLTTDLKTEIYSQFNRTVHDIYVQRNNIVLDGENHSITGLDSLGIRVEFVNNVTVKNFVLLDSAIEVYNALNINLLNNSVTTKAFGFEISHSTNVLVKENSLYDEYTQAAIFMSSTNSSTFYDNNLSCSSLEATAFRMEDSYNNFIQANNIANFGCGINLLNSSNNYFYQNSFVGNNIQAQDLFSRYQDLNELSQKINQANPKANMPIYIPSINSWKNNYWSDYNSSSSSVYRIDANNIDNSPVAKTNSNSFPTPTFTQVIFVDPAPFELITPLLIAFAIIGAIAFSLLLLYRRHRKTPKA